MYHAGDSQSGKLALCFFGLGLRPDIRNGRDPDLNATHIQHGRLVHQTARVRRGYGFSDCFRPDISD